MQRCLSTWVLSSQLAIGFESCCCTARLVRLTCLPARATSASSCGPGLVSASGQMQRSAVGRQSQSLARDLRNPEILACDACTHIIRAQYQCITWRTAPTFTAQRAYSISYNPYYDKKGRTRCRRGPRGYYNVLEILRLCWQVEIVIFIVFIFVVVVEVAEAGGQRGCGQHGGRSRNRVALVVDLHPE
jgi:hypothetical protein